MSFTSENIFLIGSMLIFVSILFSKTSYKFGVPALLLFLLIGMGVGSDGLGLRFDDVRQAQDIGTVALVIILFSGGMDTRIRDIRPVLAPGIMLSTVGVLLTTLLTGGFIYLLARFAGISGEFSLLFSMLLAATMSSTDSASVFNILRSQRLNLKHNLKPLLELESGSNDPMAYMLTLVLIDAIRSGAGISFGVLAKDLILQLLVGLALGLAAGFGTAWLLKRVPLKNAGLYPILLLSCAFFTYALTSMVNGNGFLAVYIGGLIIGNRTLPYRKETYTFMDGLTWFAQIIMFLALGLLVNPGEMLQIAPIAMLIGIFVIILGRPLSVFLCLLPFRKMPFSARLFTSWVGLRGAVPIIFATYPVVAGVPNASILFNIVFFITLFSLTIQGMTVTLAAHKMDLALPQSDATPYFGVEIPEQTGMELQEQVVTEAVLEQGERIMDLDLHSDQLVMLVKRSGDYHVPDGAFKLRRGDTLLLLSPRGISPNMTIQ